MTDIGQHEKAQEKSDTPAEVTPNGRPQPVSFPEGGWAAWLTVAGGSMVLFSTFGAVQSFGVFQDYYTRVSLTDRSPSDISWIGSFQIFLLFAMGLISGKLFDEGYFHHLILVGSLLYVFSFFMLSLTHPHNYYQTFLSQGVGIGLGMGLLYLPSVSVSSHYFRARRSLAMGIIITGSSLGGVIYPVMLNRLFNGSAGFAWGVRAAAFLVLGLLLIANFVMKTRLPSRRERPGDAKPDIKGIITDIPYLICLVGGFFIFWGLFFPFFYLQLFSALHGVPESISIYSITILNASSIFGRTLPNILADKYGNFNVIIPMTFIAGALIFAMFGAGSVGGMVAFAIFYGFFSGAFISLIVPTVATFAKSMGDVGSCIGIAMFFVSFALLTGTPITGALLDPPHYNWFRPIIFSGVVVIAGTGLLVVSRSMAAKKKGTWRV